jgi:hypothetical protein
MDFLFLLKSSIPKINRARSLRKRCLKRLGKISTVFFFLKKYFFFLPRRWGKIMKVKEWNVDAPPIP